MCFGKNIMHTFDYFSSKNPHFLLSLTNAKQLLHTTSLMTNRTCPCVKQHNSFFRELSKMSYNKPTHRVTLRNHN